MRKLTAILCLTLAVFLGSAGVSWSADFNKGLDAYESGDYATALREWKPLAEQGNAIAQTNLGVMYQQGIGVPQDFEAAVKWYKLAAEQGYGSAQLKLGFMYGIGKGVKLDIARVHMWLSLAASNGEASGKPMRDLIEKSMSPAEISKAQKLARECVRKKYKGC